ncbi:acyl-CoA hydrolase [Paraburkholderia sp. GAS448]|uniref:acetyl-CoA hydrolase/transferase family protein n=1 Tax=Paraburkholderia sp. GAS448 TaxID=3035136 RepID=UPI003D233F3C
MAIVIVSISVAEFYLIALARQSRARVVIAEVNTAAPCTYGLSVLEAGDFDVLVPTHRAPLERSLSSVGDTEMRIARHAASLIEDGATLQCGIGALPEAILAQLTDRRDLGIHSGTIGDAVVDLCERGVVTNARKRENTGVTIAGTMMGSRRVYTFAHRNRAVQLRPTAYTHDIDVLGRIDRFVAVNAAIEVDLTGQVNAEMVAGRYIGAVGGAIDFMRGAARSHGGVPLVALSASARGSSRIVAKLSGPASTSRADAGVIVTEHGYADLRGLTLRQRVRRMLDIAAPESRAALEEEAARAGLRL